MLARVAVLVSFPVPLTTWLAPTPSEFMQSFQPALAAVFGGAGLPDTFTGATWLGDSKAAVRAGVSMTDYLAQHFSLHDAFLGYSQGSLGETSALLALLGGGWLLYKRIISWHIPVTLLGTLAVLSGLFAYVEPEGFAGARFHLLTGGALIGAFFYATDYVTSPTTGLGKVVFGVGCGLLLFSIRCWGSFPEAMAFSILFMNAVSPLIDRITKPRIYGRTRTGNAVKHVPMRRSVQ